jgi:pimeloyl-ACP methyl ester carboxylesterase
LGAELDDLFFEYGMLKLKLKMVLLMLYSGLWNVAAGQDLLSYKNRSDSVLPVKTKKEWYLKRNQILDSMQAVMGKLPSIDHRRIPPVQVLDSLPEIGFTRFKITLTVADSEDCFAYLYIPKTGKISEKLPAILALHETDVLGKGSVDGQEKNKNLAYARELAEKGYVVIAPDYPSFGDATEEDFTNTRYASGTIKGVFNHMRCIDYLVSRKEVDPDKIGAIGHSLGGHNALFVGAFDTRIKVVVASCGWTLFDFYNIGENAAAKYGGRLGPWAQNRYMPLLKEKYKLDAAKMPFDFDEVIAATAPRAVFSSSPLKDGNFDVKGVKKGIENASAVYRFLQVTQNLEVRYPDSGHDFPNEARAAAYAFIDGILKNK